MRSSRINPKLSAYAQLFGQFDYNAMPLAPPSCKCTIYDKPIACKSWAVHGTKAYYTAPAMKHYRYYEVHVQRTLAKRIANTITFLPHNITMPNIISTKNAISLIKDLIKLLRNHKPHHPIAQHNDNSITALHTLADIFNIAPSNSNTPTTPKPITTKKMPYLKTPAAPRVQVNDTSTAASPRVCNEHSPDNATPTTNHFTTNNPTVVPHSHPYNTQSKSHVANAVLNTETGLMEEYRQLHKGKDKTI